VGTISSTIVASALVASGPIVIDGERDVVISGLHITNPTGNCITLRGSSNIIIENSEIGPCGQGKDIPGDPSGFGIRIYAGNSHVTIRNNYFHDTVSHAILSTKSHHIAVDGNVFERVWSAYKMAQTSEGYLSFTNNFVKNIGWNSVGQGQDIHGNRGASNIVGGAYLHGAACRVTACCNMMFKLGRCAEKKWRRLRGFDYLVEVVTGIKFKDGVEVTEVDQATA